MANGKGKTAVIIGAGPAGLTAAYELIENQLGIKPVIFEISDQVGGLSRTVKYKGNRIDIGGHRFFSKSDVVVRWWLNILPLQGAPDPDPEKTDQVMLKRSRLSRIYFLRKFFNYPISLTVETLRNLGIVRVVGIGLSYGKACLFPIKKESNLEDFYINRFGKILYKTFFKDYTEKVWGVSCRDIKPEWGAQRIKGLSITKAITHALKKFFTRDQSIAQKGTETSLIERFMYPKHGPGQMWEEVTRQILAKGAELHFSHDVVGLELRDGRIASVVARDQNGAEKKVEADYVISTMPVKELIAAIDRTSHNVDQDIKKIAEGLVYRDFMTVGLLLNKMRTTDDRKIAPDNWIYIQEPDVKLCRLQIFNNWSPYMVQDPSKVWVGLEYMCTEGDELWTMADEKFMDFAINELASIDIIDKEDVLDKTMIRMPKAYPAYFGTYDQFSRVKEFTNTIDNLFLIGRNGMHRYNNQDHSMLTAIETVKNIAQGKKDKNNIWNVNVEQTYHEEKRS